MNQNIFDNIKEEIDRRLLKESIPRIKQCLSELSFEQLWYQHNDNSNSVANLVLHLCGNVRQYFINGMFGKADTRNRSKEFSIKKSFTNVELTKELDQLALEIEQAIQLIEYDQFCKLYKVQGFQESGMSIIIHVIEHFSYHTGQITFFTKWVKDIDTGYYAGKDLNKKND